MAAARLSNFFNKQTIITGLVGIVIWLSVFLAINSDVRNWLLADVTGTISIENIAWDVAYYTTATKLIVVSNIDSLWLQSATILISNSPETEVLLKSPDTSTASIEKMWPSMSRYTFPITDLSKWKTIATFSYNGDPEDVSVSDVELRNDAMEIITLSVTNANLSVNNANQ